MKIDGIEVRDATRPVVLHIRDADARSGKKDPGNCAAAKAACRIEGVIEARIYRTRSYLLMQDSRTEKKFWKRFNTPGAIRNELIAFDRGGTFQPDDYQLGVITPNERIGSERTRGAPTGPKKSKRPTPHIVKGIRAPAPKGPEW